MTGARRRVLLAGGGHAHIVALRHLVPRPLNQCDLTLISPNALTWYSGALPGAIAGHWPASTITTDVAALARAAGAEFVEGNIDAIDAGGQAVSVGGKRLPYDLLLLDIGSASRDLPHLSAMPEFLNVRPIPDFVASVESALGAIARGEAPAQAVILGGGLGGIELAFALHYRLTKSSAATTPKVTLIEAGDEIAGGASPALRQALMAALARKGIHVRTGTRATGFDARKLVLSDGSDIGTGLVVNATGAAAHRFLADSDLATVSGFVAVDTCLRARFHPEIWASGDTAWFESQPLPAAGVYAVRQGPHLAENLHRWQAGEPLQEFHPQTDYLKLVSLGGREAIAEKAGLALSLPGARTLLWHLKKSIDFGFLAANRRAAGD
ncbi:MAG: FAD-dependent oxidoreductase [Hyphomonas sp.]|nr:FAD-dependent oxidoreductase [Hyphomonas sp.]